MLQLGLYALLASLSWAAPDPADPVGIYGGTPVPAGAWPSTVAIQMFDLICTGTLVSDRIVLTAAHCLERMPSVAGMQVILGDDITDPARQVVGVRSYGIHPEYCGSDTTKCKVDIWDYGYVELETPVDVPPTRPLTLQEEWDQAMRVGKPLVLVGFGENEKMLSGIKRQVEVEIVRFSESGLEFQAGGMGLDSCQGDSGGPAFFRLDTGEYILAGITSRGYSCGKGGFYAIPYASLCWLAQETGVDLRTDACETCDCLDLSTSDEEKGCGCATDREAAGPFGFAVLALFALSRPRARRARTSRP